MDVDKRKMFQIQLKWMQTYTHRVEQLSKTSSSHEISPVAQPRPMPDFQHEPQSIATFESGFKHRGDMFTVDDRAKVHLLWQNSDLQSIRGMLIAFFQMNHQSTHLLRLFKLNNNSVIHLRRLTLGTMV